MDIEELIEEAQELIDKTRSYNFGMYYADRLAHEIAGQLVGAIEELQAKRDAAEDRIAELEQSLRSESLAHRVDAALLRVYQRHFAEAAKLHRKRKHWNSDREDVFVCDECTRINRYGIAHWPCPTAVSLGLNEGENENE